MRGGMGGSSGGAMLSASDRSPRAERRPTAKVIERVIHGGVRRTVATGLLLACLLLGPAAVAAGDVGHRDQSFAAPGVVKPSGQKPQSKLWYADGTWWGSLFDAGSATFHVQRFDPAGERWIDTGTQLDDRSSSHADTLWDGTHLYVASASEASPDIRVLRLVYDA